MLTILLFDFTKNHSQVLRNITESEAEAQRKAFEFLRGKSSALAVVRRDNITLKSYETNNGVISEFF